MLRQGFFGSRTVSSSLPEVKETSPSTLATKEDSTASSQKLGPPITELQDSHLISTTISPEFSGGSSSRVAELGMRLSLSRLVLLEGWAPIYISISKS